MTHPHLPEGWPSDHTALTHDQLDNYGIERKAGKYDLSLKERQQIYCGKYLASDDERAAAAERWKYTKRRIWVFGGLFAIAFAALVFSCDIYGPDESDDAAIATCQVNVREKLKDPSSASFDPGASTQKGSSDRVRKVTGTGTGANSLGGKVKFQYVCEMTWNYSAERYEVRSSVVNE